jgi:hypothetical protein
MNTLGWRVLLQSEEEYDVIILLYSVSMEAARICARAHIFCDTRSARADLPLLMWKQCFLFFADLSDVAANEQDKSYQKYSNDENIELMPKWF